MEFIMGLVVAFGISIGIFINVDDTYGIERNKLKLVEEVCESVGSTPISYDLRYATCANHSVVDIREYSKAKEKE